MQQPSQDKRLAIVAAIPKPREIECRLQQIQTEAIILRQLLKVARRRDQVDELLAQAERAVNRGA